MKGNKPRNGANLRMCFQTEEETAASSISSPHKGVRGHSAQSQMIYGPDGRGQILTRAANQIYHDESFLAKRPECARF